MSNGAAPPKPGRRLSFRTKSLSSKDANAQQSDNIASNAASALSGGLKTVKGSLRRLRRFSNSVAQTAARSTASPQDAEASLDTPPHSFPQSSPRSAIKRLQSFTREPISRLKDMGLSELKSVVEETGAELGKRGRDVADRWRKKNNNQAVPNGLSSVASPLHNVKIFGTPLKAAVKLTRLEKNKINIAADPSRYWLPAVMVRCLEYLDAYGLEEVGIHRVSGSQTALDRMCKVIDSGADLDFLQNSREDPHAVAALMRRYLRELPEPILTETKIDEFNACIARHAGAASSVRTTTYFNSPPTIPPALPFDLAPIVSTLPPYEFYLLHALCSHLARIDCRADRNKMSISNLGLIFCPTLNIGTLLFQTFVAHLDIVFSSGCEAEQQELCADEQTFKEGTPTVYHLTNISEDFSKSFEDILTLDENPAPSSSHSCSSPSSTGSALIKDIESDGESEHDTLKSITDSAYSIMSDSKGSPTILSVSSTSALTLGDQSPGQNRHNDHDLLLGRNQHNNQCYYHSDGSLLNLSTVPRQRRPWPSLGSSKQWERPIPDHSAQSATSTVGRTIWNLEKEGNT